MTMDTPDTDKLLLEEFIFENDDLDKLEGLLARFNFFEAIGAVNRELRHSDFLGFLFDPAGNHGLREIILKRFCMLFFKKHRGAINQNIIEADSYDYDSFEVLREWKNIDILMVSKKEKLVIAIENKILTTEHSDQLNRYRRIIEGEFSDFEHVFCYLTPEGDKPQTDDKWLTYSYGEVAGLLSNTLENFKSNIGDDIAFVIRQYVEMLERHIMSDSEVSKLCLKIYKQHKQALDLIFEHKPDKTAEMQEKVVDVLNELTNDYELELDHCSKAYMRFSPKAWDVIEGQKSGQGRWTKTNRVVLFEIQNYNSSLSLYLYIGPGDKTYREGVFKRAEQDKKLFSGITGKGLTPEYTQIFKQSIISKKDYEAHEPEELKEDIAKKLKKLLDENITKFSKILFDM